MDSAPAVSCDLHWSMRATEMSHPFLRQTGTCRYHRSVDTISSSSWGKGGWVSSIWPNRSSPFAEGSP